LKESFVDFFSSLFLSCYIEDLQIKQKRFRRYILGKSVSRLSFADQLRSLISLKPKLSLRFVEGIVSPKASLPKRIEGTSYFRFFSSQSDTIAFLSLF
jgi:hypothetical protein